MVLINGIRLLEGPRQSPTGNFQHVAHLTQAMAAEGFTGFRLLTDAASHIPYSGYLPAEFLIRSPYSGHGLLGANHAALSALREFRPTIYHRPTGHLPFGPLRCKTIGGVPDLNFRVLPVPVLRRLYKELSVRWTFRRADCLVCVSEFTKQHLLTDYRPDPRKVRVIGHGTNPLPEPARPERLDPSASYVLSFAHFPHKNTELALRAHERLASTSHPSFRHVVVGDNDYVTGRLVPLARQLGLTDCTTFVGSVARSELSWLYRHAIALLFPSRFEGFGLPILEAMGSDCPVIASNVCSIPEVAGEAAILVDPDDVHGLADAIVRVSLDHKVRSEIIEAGRRRAAQFTWARAARRTISLYRELDPS